MHKIWTGMILGAMLSASAHSQAATSINTNAFTISYTDGNRRAQWNIGLSEASSGFATIDLGTLNQQLGNVMVRPNNRYPAEATAQHYSLFHIDVHNGFKISSLALSGNVQGRYEAFWQPGEQPGYAENGADLRWNVSTASGLASRNALSEQLLNGNLQFNSSISDFNYGSSFDVALNGWTSAYAQPSPDGAWGPAAMAFIGIYGTKLRVDFAPVTSPVPEPATGAMLLGGLALLAVAARRRACKD